MSDPILYHFEVNTWHLYLVRGHTNFWKTWPLWNKEKLLLSKIVQENASQKNERYWTDGQNTAPIVQSQGWWRFISIKLSSDTSRRPPPHPSQRNGGCSTIIEEREVSSSRQHPNRTGPSRWRGCNHLSHDHLQKDLADRRMVNPMDSVLSHHTSQERHHAAVLELPNDQPP